METIMCSLTILVDYFEHYLYLRLTLVNTYYYSQLTVVVAYLYYQLTMFLTTCCI